MFVSAFSTQKARFEESKYKNFIWLCIKRNFLEKIAFWVCEENVQCHKGPQRCILKKARARWFISVGLTAQLPNYSSINQKISSVLTPRFLIPLISSLCYALCPEAHSHPIIFFFFLCLLQHAFLCIFF